MCFTVGRVQLQEGSNPKRYYISFPGPYREHLRNSGTGSKGAEGAVSYSAVFSEEARSLKYIWRGKLLSLGKPASNRHCVLVSNGSEIGLLVLFSFSGSEAASWTSVPVGLWVIALLCSVFLFCPRSCFTNTIHTIIGWTFSFYSGFALIRLLWDVFWGKRERKDIES